MSKKIIPFLLLFIIVFFVFIRVFKINESLYFFGDMGRDFLVMHNWLESGKPPLLGPQNSALPFNQSPVYFYFLFIFYIATNFSLYSTIIASLIFHISIVLIGYFLLKKNTSLTFGWLFTWILITFNPQHVIQNRYVWNPSFVSAFLALAFFTLLLMKQKVTRILSLFYCFSLALAVGFSYSAVPTVLIMVIAQFFVLDLKTSLKLFAGLIGAGIVIHIPLVFFELRHNFTLIHLMLNYEKIESITVSPLETILKISELVISSNFFQFIFPILLTLLGMYIFRYRKTFIKDNLVSEEFLAVSILIANILLLVVLPVTIHSHYIFGILTFFCTSIALMKGKTKYILGTLLLFIWLQPTLLSSYFKAAARTPLETQACAQQVCRTMTEPTFVSKQSINHDHAGPEFRYLFSKEGCQVIDIEQPAELVGSVKKMLVVADSSVYEHTKTSYDELSRFGAATESAVVTCTENLKVHVLTRD